MLDNTAKAIISAGWANETFGSVDELGHYALITIAQNEVSELVEAVFDGTLPEGETVEDITGNFIVREDEQGFAYVAGWETADIAKRKFDELREDYNNRWDDES